MGPGVGKLLSAALPYDYLVGCPLALGSRVPRICWVRSRIFTSLGSSGAPRGPLGGSGCLWLMYRI